MRNFLFRLSVSVFCCLMLLCLLSSCGTPEGYTEEYQKLKKGGKLVIERNIHSASAEYTTAFDDNLRLLSLVNPQKDNMHLDYSMAYFILKPGRRVPLHYVENSEVYYIIGGAGMLTVDGTAYILKPGKCIYVPPSARQKLVNNSSETLKFLVIDNPPWQPDRQLVLEDMRKEKSAEKKKVEKAQEKKQKGKDKEAAAIYDDGSEKVKIKVNQNQKLMDENKHLLKQGGNQEKQLGLQVLTKQEDQAANNELKTDKQLDNSVKPEAKPKPKSQSQWGNAIKENSPSLKADTELKKQHEEPVLKDKAAIPEQNNTGTQGTKDDNLEQLLKESRELLKKDSDNKSSLESTTDEDLDRLLKESREMLKARDDDTKNVNPEKDQNTTNQKAKGRNLQ